MDKSTEQHEARERELIREYKERTGIPGEEKAVEALTNNGWNLDAAVHQSLHRLIHKTLDRIRRERWERERLAKEIKDAGIGDDQGVAAPLPPVLEIIKIPKPQRPVQYVNLDDGAREPFIPTEGLILPNVGDELAGSIAFTQTFIQRFGHCRPMFIEGSLGWAQFIAGSTKRLLAIYLHDDGWGASDHFCHQVLCNPVVVGLLTEKCITWGWDVTHEANMDLVRPVLKSLLPKRAMPGTAGSRSKKPIKTPALLLLVIGGEKPRLYSILGAGNTFEQVVRTLTSTEQFMPEGQAPKVPNQQEPQNKSERAALIAEQDKAYEEGLRMDSAKAEEAAKQKRLEAEAAAAEALKKEEQNCMEAAKKEEQKHLEAAKEDAVRSLTPEPEPDNEGSEVVILRCRLPGGRLVTRKFLKTSDLGSLYKFLLSEGCAQQSHRILFSHPKQDLGQEFGEEECLGSIFSARDTIYVEQL